MKQHYIKILQDTDKRICRSLQIQLTDINELPGNLALYLGGFRDGDGLVEPKFAIYRVTTMIAGYFNKDSQWFMHSLLYDRIVLGLTYIAGAQRENGFFDLINCNFYSGPDTAFCLKRLIPVYHYLKLLINEPHKLTVLLNTAADSVTDTFLIEKANYLSQIICSIIKKGADAMKHCGFHTPNHRWAIASVLMLCSKLFHDSSYADAAAIFLSEGIDNNDDGEYAERSAGNYNRICNDAMIMLSEATGDPVYLDYARKNLIMMLHYIEPDKSIFTSNSTRQDRGKKIYPKDYYLEYLILGIIDQNEVFLKAANAIMELVSEKGLRSMDCLIHFMYMPALLSCESDVSGFLTTYHKHFEESGLVRVRNEQYSYSLQNHASSFLTFQHGDFTVCMKIGASFCEHRAFQPETILPVQNGYVMKQTMQGWYYLPFEEPAGTTDWWAMDHSKRNKLNGPDLTFTVSIIQILDGIEVSITASGIDRAPVRVELSFDCGCRIDSSSFSTEGIPSGGMVVRQGLLTASKGEYGIKVGPAFGSHEFTAGKFGSDSRNKECFTVYFTDYTCFEHTISLRAVSSRY